MKKALLLLVVVILLGAACTKGQNNQPPTNENTNTNIENSEAFSDLSGTAAPTEAEGATTTDSAAQAVSGVQTDQPEGPRIDGYGCKPYSGYERNDDLRVCVNPLVVQDENVFKAVKLAVDYYRPWYSLTVLSVTPGATVGDYTVVLEAYDEKTIVNIDDWTITP